MKKIFWAIALFSIFAGVLYSCTKEDSMTKENANSPQMSAEDLRVMNLIVDFKKKVDFFRANPNIKSGESKSVDSTVWYLEAATNFYNADASFESNDFLIDSTEIDIPKSNDEVLLSDIQIAYSNIENTIAAQLANIQDNSKALVFSDVTIEKIESDKVTLKVFSGIGKGDNSTFSDDDWHYGEDLGKCDFSNPGTDAADIINAYCNATVDHHLNVCHYFTDIDDMTTSGYWGYNSYVWGYYVINNNPVVPTPCLTENEISYWEEKALTFAGNIPPGHEVIKYYIHDNRYLYHNYQTGQYHHHFWHYETLTHGKLHFCGPDDIH